MSTYYGEPWPGFFRDNQQLTTSLTKDLLTNQQSEDYYNLYKQQWLEDVNCELTKDDLPGHTHCSSEKLSWPEEIEQPAVLGQEYSLASTDGDSIVSFDDTYMITNMTATVTTAPDLTLDGDARVHIGDRTVTAGEIVQALDAQNELVQRLEQLEQRMVEMLIVPQQHLEPEQMIRPSTEETNQAPEDPFG